MTNENESKPEVHNPLIDNKPIDLTGIMNIAGSLLKNPEVLNTVSDVMKLTSHETPNKTEQLQENTIPELKKQIAEMNQQINDLQNQITRYNDELRELIIKIQSSLDKRSGGSNFKGLWKKNRL